MLTRSGVAKRLGKSLATVRRMEGVELHPTRDERGVHHFDPEEVEAVARGEILTDRSHRLGAPWLGERIERYEPMERVRVSSAEDVERERMREQKRRAEVVRDEVAKQVLEQVARMERERLIADVLDTIEEGDGVLDDDDIDELWEVVDALTEET